MRLDGKVALLTGGTRGIGRGVVEMLAAEGAAVAFTGRSDTGRAVEAGVNEAGGRALYIRADNGVEEQVAKAVAATVEQFGSLTTLVNNAISDEVGGGNDSHVDEVDDDTFGLTRQMAVDFGKDDIRANAIIVGFIYTGTDAMAPILDNPAYRAAFEKNIMVPRFGEPADIAAGVVYLASDESKYVTGIELTIDGGALCHQALPELDFEGMRASQDT